MRRVSILFLVLIILVTNNLFADEVNEKSTDYISSYYQYLKQFAGREKEVNIFGGNTLAKNTGKNAILFNYNNSENPELITLDFYNDKNLPEYACLIEIISFDKGEIHKLTYNGKEYVEYEDESEKPNIYLCKDVNSKQKFLTIESGYHGGTAEHTDTVSVLRINNFEIDIENKFRKNTLSYREENEDGKIEWISEYEYFVDSTEVDQNSYEESLKDFNDSIEKTPILPEDLCEEKIRNILGADQLKKVELSDNERGDLNLYLSNYVEVNLPYFKYNAADYKELVIWSIWHNYRNNYKLFQQLFQYESGKKDYGLSIDKEYIERSIEKYFNINSREHENLFRSNFDPYSKYLLEDNKYYFLPADGDPTRFAYLDNLYEVSSNIYFGEIIEISCAHDYDGGFGSIYELSYNQITKLENQGFMDMLNRSQVIIQKLNESGTERYILLEYTPSNEVPVYLQLHNKVESKSIKLTTSQEKITITEGSHSFINLNTSEKDTALTYESDNLEIVQVDTNGQITAVKEGTANITVTAKKLGFKNSQIKMPITILPKENLEDEKVKSELKQTNYLETIPQDTDAESYIINPYFLILIGVLLVILIGIGWYWRKRKNE